MADRHFTQFRYSLEKNVVDLYAKVTIGGTGAPTLTRGKGIASVVRNSAGEYQITLSDKYSNLLYVKAQVIAASGLAAAPVMAVQTEDVSGAKTIVIQFSQVGTTPAATELTSGDVVLLQITLSNSKAV